jgi:hypothetical protein
MNNVPTGGGFRGSSLHARARALCTPDVAATRAREALRRLRPRRIVATDRVASASGRRRRGEILRRPELAPAAGGASRDLARGRGARWDDSDARRDRARARVDHGEDYGPGADGRLIPALLRDFRPRATPRSVLRDPPQRRGDARGDGGGDGDDKAKAKAKVAVAFVTSGRATTREGLFGSYATDAAFAAAAAANARTRRARTAPAAAPAPRDTPTGGEGEAAKSARSEERRRRHRLSRFRRHYLPADAPGAPRADPAAATASSKPRPSPPSPPPSPSPSPPPKKHRRKTWDVDMRPARRQGIIPRGTAPPGTTQLACAAAADAAAVVANRPAEDRERYQRRIVTTCAREHVDGIVRRAREGSRCARLGARGA